MSEYDRQQAQRDADARIVRDMQNQHWKTQQDYNAALDAARKAAAEKR